MFSTSKLARFVASVDSVPTKTLHASRRVLLDTLGTAAAGASTSAGVAALKGATASWGTGVSPVWFSDQRLPQSGAAFVNAAHASMLDLDDGHRLASGHPGAAIVPAVLAVAEQYGVKGEGILTAIAIGYEVGLRVAASRDINTLRTVDTGRWCGYGVVAATGWLRKAPPQTIGHAMAIVGHTASSQAATGWTRLGHNVKEGIPFATAAALTAFELAEAGYTGPLDLLNDPERYNQERLLEGLGESWQIERGYFKLYSACRWAHAPIDGALKLQKELCILPEQIDEIEIGLFARALTLLNAPEPDSVDGAQYSIPFSVALALIHGSSALLPVTQDHLSDERVRALAKRIRLIHNPDLDELFPAATPADVNIRFNGNPVNVHVPAPKGEPSLPLSDEELSDKFVILTKDTMSQQSQKNLMRILDPTYELDAARLASLMISR